MTSKSKSLVAAKLLKDIRAEMERQGVTQKELANRLGCTAPNVRQLLYSNPGLRISTAERLANALGFDLDVRLVARDTAGESGE
jgi:transcriptional regulator with XRE-family HTH domain